MRKTIMSLKPVSTQLLLLACLIPLAGADIAPPMTADTLLADLVKEDGSVRARARQLLPRFGAEAVPGLTMLLSHNDENIWRTAYAILNDIAHQPAPIRMDNQPAAPGRVAVEQALLPLANLNHDAALVKRVLSLLPVVVTEETDLSPVAALLADAGLKERARACLEECGTVNAARALAAVTEAQADLGFQYALLNALFGKTDKVGDLGFAVRLCDSSSGPVRASAARLLAETGKTEYAETIFGVARKADEAGSAEAWDVCLRYAEALARGGGKWEAAMSAYKTLLRDGPDTVVKSGAIASLGRFGDESCIPLFLETLNGPDAAQFASPVLNALSSLQGNAVNLALLDIWGKLPADMRPGLLQNMGARHDAQFMPLLREQVASKDAALRLTAIKVLSESGQPDAASVLFQALESADASEKPLIQDLLARYTSDIEGQVKSETDKHGFVQKWAIIGPFPWRATDGFGKNFIGEPKFDLRGSYPGSSGNVTWKAATSFDPSGVFSLVDVLGEAKDAIACGYTEIQVAEDMDAVIHAGSDDGLKIWVNETVVSEKEVDRIFNPEADVVPVKLKTGRNALFVMVSQRLGGWNFGIRLTLPDGTVPNFKVLQPQP